jgi:hypothetical protein
VKSFESTTDEAVVLASRKRFREPPEGVRDVLRSRPLDAVREVLEQRTPCKNVASAVFHAASSSCEAPPGFLSVTTR